MPGQHATLSPSSAERWIECPASIRMQSKVPPEAESAYAAEGTCAHELAELKASLRFNKITPAQFDNRLTRWMRKWSEYADHDDIYAEMDRHTDAYVELLVERSQVYPNTQVMLEQRMATGVPNSWGTSDAVLVSPVHVEIVDFKYGAGVAVEANGNPQLKLYALGALDTYGDILGDTETVLTTVHQPRMDHILTAELTPEAIRAWRENVVIPVAKEALGPDARFGPSEQACRWCPASGRCAAQVQAAFPDDLLDDDPELLSPEQMAEYLGKIGPLKDWLNAFEAAALTQAYSEGVHIPGYKVVRSGGQRKFVDPDGAIQFLYTIGHTKDEVTTTKLRGIGELEKLLGKDEFANKLAPFLGRTEGRESLVPESDKRESISPNMEAINAFDDIEETT